MNNMNELSGVYVFEGIDNVGKSTLVKAVREQIIAILGCDCVDIAFPGNEPRTLGSLVYDIHHHMENYFDMGINEASLQLMHIASHIDLIERRIKALTRQKCVVLLDRFWWSTYAYGLAGNLDEETINTIIAPEKIYWTKINIKKIFLIERNNRNHDYSNKTEEIIKEQYRKLLHNNPQSLLISNDGRIEETVAEILSQIVGE